MKRATLLLLPLLGVAHAIEIHYGQGSFEMQGGFLGLSGEINCDINTFSLENRHSNIQRFYYGYDLTWYDSQKMVQAQQTYNTMANQGNRLFTNLPMGEHATIPEIGYRFKGLDANFQLGYDLMHQSDEAYLGAGLLLGISMPWVDASKNDSATPNLGFMLDNAGNILDANEMFAQSKTELMTYKVGPTLTWQTPLIGKELFLTGSASYTYQTGYIKNHYAHADFSVHGTYQSYDIGLKFIPFNHEFEWGWLTLSSKFYATLGYRYNQWDLNKINIDISGNKISSDILDPLAIQFNMNSSVGYFGIGYSF